MRISDWSSDVFSSDLILGQHDRRELQPAGAADIIVHIVDEIPERVLADHDEARAGDADARKIVGDEGERQRADRDVAAELRTREPALELHPLELRSEEHTSELQSLLRTSYAVFCLKKKNHK